MMRCMQLLLRLVMPIRPFNTSSTTVGLNVNAKALSRCACFTRFAIAVVSVTQMTQRAIKHLETPRRRPKGSCITAPSQSASCLPAASGELSNQPCNRQHCRLAQMQSPPIDGLSANSYARKSTIKCSKRNIQSKFWGGRIEKFINLTARQGQRSCS